MDNSISDIILGGLTIAGSISALILARKQTIKNLNAASEKLILVSPVHDYFEVPSAVVTNYRMLMEAYSLTNNDQIKNKALDMALVVESGLDRIINNELDLYVHNNIKCPKDASLMSETYKNTFGRYGRASELKAA